MGNSTPSNITVAVPQREESAGTELQKDLSVLETGGVDDTAAVREHYTSSVLDEAVNIINDHLRSFRAIPWVVGGVGALLVIKYSGLFTRYRHASHVPLRLITANSQLRGVVSKTYWNSVGVWHVPLTRRILRWQRVPPKSCPEDRLLCVQFAGVAIGQPEDSEQWLGRELGGRTVWLKLLHRTADNNALQCVVYTRKKGFLRSKFCVNEELIANGLGSIDDVQGFKRNEDFVKFVEALTRREKAAKSRGVGVWEGSEHESWWWRVVRFFRRQRKTPTDST